jgi:hypothetical protein
VSDTVIELSAEQAAMLNFVEEGAAGLNFVTVAERDFTQEIHTIGSVDYNQNRIVTVYAHYQGRIEEARGNIGDPVEKGDFLFSMQSPDLLAAEEALISGAGSSVLQGKTLARARALLKIGGISEMAADQAVSDEQTAQGSVRSARANVRIFGKTDSEIDRVIAERRVDPLLVVKSPISGVIVARGASPGQFVQPTDGGAGGNLRSRTPPARRHVRRYDHPDRRSDPFHGHPRVGGLSRGRWRDDGLDNEGQTTVHPEICQNGQSRGRFRPDPVRDQTRRYSRKRRRSHAFKNGAS